VLPAPSVPSVPSLRDLMVDACMLPSTRKRRLLARPALEECRGGFGAKGWLDSAYVESQKDPYPRTGVRSMLCAFRARQDTLEASPLR